MFERLNSLWIGEKLSYVEQLTIVSALSVDHPFTLYSYTPERLRNVPRGAEVRDAREVIQYEILERYLNGRLAAVASDFFRCAVQAKALGYWVDLDLYFLRPIDFHDDYVFGWENEKSINGAVMRLPRDCRMLRELCDIPHTNWKPPYYGPRKTALFYWSRLITGDVYPENYRWGAFGPAILTHLAKKYSVSKKAKNRSVFYPIRHCETFLLYGPPESVNRLLTAETRTVHLWRSVLSEEAKVSPPCGSYLEAACRSCGSYT
jgi:hypothetical protein